jgi:hypothetical protein
MRPPSKRRSPPLGAFGSAPARTLVDPDGLSSTVQPASHQRRSKRCPRLGPDAPGGNAGIEWDSSARVDEHRSDLRAVAGLWTPSADPQILPGSYGMATAHLPVRTWRTAVSAWSTMHPCLSLPQSNRLRPVDQLWRVPRAVAAQWRRSPERASPLAASPT